MTMEEKVQQQEIMLPVKTLKKLGIDIIWLSPIYK